MRIKSGGDFISGILQLSTVQSCVRSTETGSHAPVQQAPNHAGETQSESHFASRATKLCALASLIPFRRPCNLTFCCKVLSQSIVSKYCLKVLQTVPSRHVVCRPKKAHLPVVYMAGMEGLASTVALHNHLCAEGELLQCCSAVHGADENTAQHAEYPAAKPATTMLQKWCILFGRCVQNCARKQSSPQD